MVKLTLYFQLINSPKLFSFGIIKIGIHVTNKYTSKRDSKSYRPLLKKQQLLLKRGTTFFKFLIFFPLFINQLL